MKKQRPIKHAHRKAMIAQKKAKGKFSKPHLPGTTFYGTCYADCKKCWANGTHLCS